MLNEKMRILFAALLCLCLSGCILEAGSGENVGAGDGSGGDGGNGGGNGGGDGGDCGDGGDTVGAAGRCDSRLSASNASASVVLGAGCVGCTVVDEANVLTPAIDDLAVVSTALSLLPVGGQSNVGIDVTLNGAQAGTDTNPGFIVSFPDVSTLSLGVAPSIQVSTLTAGVVVDSETYNFGILGNTVGIGALGLVDINNAEVFIGVPATTAYDGLRFEIGGVVANALLTVNVYGACTDGVSGSLDGDSPI